ncbi:hypothetical protein [Methylosinus sp. PW1]|uniref:hypothetical protein n=1 Tax=Methylosinus sp. PW1 TaxID=107636 RepID=UPI00056435BC|nr:hypothetical protein [Methylosinus sp. PW1]
MSKVLFWDFEGVVARRAPDWRLAEGAAETLEALAAKGWTHIAFAAGTQDLAAVAEGLGLAGRFAGLHDAGEGAEPLARAIEAARPFDQAFVIAASVAGAVLPARAAVVPSILVGDASPLAQFCCESPSEIELALETWTSMRRSFFAEP